ncbi:MAG: hypothetical protein ACI399_05735 [Candidatus Cryptobacteroides sp.]
MKSRIFTLAASALLLAAISCQSDNKGDSKDSVEGVFAPDVYWETGYSGKYGIQTGSAINKPDAPRMQLGGKPLYVTGVNCYNLFVQCHEADNMQTGQMQETVNVLAQEKVPIVRFSCSPFYASQMHFYTEQKEAYLANLKELAELCDQKHILLIPSIFWNTSCLPEYFGESLSAWGDTESRTYGFMVSYTTDIVNTLKDHKCIAAWEFGNEFNLAADIGSQGYPDIPAKAVGTAYKGFAQTIKALDNHGRMICSGNSVMRNAQWNLANNGSWSNDSFKQYVEITGVMTPDPMNGMSEHIYEESRVFSDLGTLNRTYQIIRAKEAAESLGKLYYVGEFTGPMTARGDSSIVKNHYAAYLSQKVQLSLIWNYALKGDIEWSFKAGTEYGDMAFRNIRKYNELFKTMKPE